MKGLQPTRWRALAEHLDALLTLPPLDRDRRLEEIAANDPATAADLQALLAARNDASQAGFLHGVADAAALPLTATAGDALGAWTLVEPVGEGGMGSVWRARRNDGRYEGQAAVKLLRSGLFDPAAQERFRREGAILARLQHPGVARLLDAGITARGQPFLVLEFVPGAHIDRWCEDKALSVRARLELFVQVLDAVTSAHVQLVIHRDLKPSNIVVDPDGRVKLLDFGIARMLDEQADVALTREGALALTPRYAAPEQFDGGALSMATDVFALGVVLYELLTGSHPSGHGAGGSDRQYAEAASAEGYRLASQRAPESRRALRGDLDNILARALRADPGQRYATVAELRDDLQRHLNLLPVRARPPSWGYRSSRFLRRNPWASAIAAALFLAITLGVAGTLSQSRRAEAEAVQARAERSHAVAAAAESDRLRSQAEAQSQRAEQAGLRAESAAQHALAAAALARQAAAQAGREKARAQSLLARSIASEQFNNDLLVHAANSGRALDFKALLARGEAMATRENTDPRYQITALMTLADFYETVGEADKASKLAEKATAAAEKMGDRSLAAQARCIQGTSLALVNQPVPGEAMIRQALRSVPNDVEVQTGCWYALSQLAVQQRNGPAALDAARRALAASNASPLRPPAQTALFLTALADAHRLLGDARSADATYAQALKAIEAAGLGDGPEASNVLNNWGVLAVESGQLLKSLDLVRRAIAIEEANMGSDKVNAAMLLNLGRRLNDLNRLDEAWATMERAGARAAASGLKLIQAYAEQGFAKIRRLQGRFDEALGHLERSRALLGTLSPSSQQAIGLQFAKASIEQDAGRTEAALATLDEARRNFDAQAARAGGRDKLPKVWMGWLQQHASVLGDAGRAAEALPEAQEAMALARRLQGTAEFSADTGGSELLVARLQSKLGRGAEAEALAADAELQLTAALGADHPKTALARALARRVASAR